MKIQKRLLIFSITFILFSITSVYLSVYADLFFSRNNITLVHFIDCVECIKNQERCFRWWCLFEMISLCIAILIGFIRKSDRYKTDTIKVTDNIEIPAPAGEGQHGNARFANSKEIAKRYGEFTLKLDSPQLQQLFAYGDRMKKAAKYFNKGKPKARAEPIISVKATTDEADYTAQEKRLKRRGNKTYRAVDDKIQEVKDKAKNLSISRQITTAVKSRAARRYKKKILSGDESVVSKAEKIELPSKNKCNYHLAKESGLVIDYKKKIGAEQIRCINDDIHSLIVGAPGSGKSRRMVIETIMSLALAGESIIVTDPKGELHGYLHLFLKEIGYDVQVMDFQNPEYSDRQNPLQLIIDAVNNNDMTTAQTRAWDLTSLLVEKSDKGEPIWTNGEMSIIAASILCVVYDNKEHPEFQNLTNVYWFIANMCKDVKKGMSTIKPIISYVNKLPDNHPAKPLLGIADVAPSKTAGSFYTSALTTLRLFTANDIYNITYKSDFSLAGIGKKQTALFFILPDQKTTFYPVVTLFVSQLYDSLVDTAKENGGRLPVRTNFVLDEFGNFTKITDFQTKLAVGRSYGLRFNLFLQSFSQITSKYGREDAETIKSNCQAWIGLAVPDNETAKAFEERMGEYTTTSYNVGVSLQRYAASSNSSNVSLMGRKLLMANEIMLIRQPYLLLSQLQQNPVIGNLPDLSQWSYNRMLGLGDKSHNIKFTMYSNSLRQRREPEPVHLWKIWERFIPVIYDIS